MKRSELYLLIGLGALLLLGGGGYAVYQMTRGLRNNNPGNIRLDGTRWLGMSPNQTDGTFVQFVSPEYGIRALARVLETYYTAHGLNTVAGIISRWAPPQENDTAAYIADVANHLGVDPNAPIDVSAYLPSLVAAITQHENGTQPYSVNTIEQGVTMA